jgi:hypothetical protein
VTDQSGDVASTLNELERKLRELESDLQAVVEPDVVSPVAFTEPLPSQTIGTAAQPEPPQAPATAPASGPPAGAGQPIDVRHLVAEAQHRITALRDELDGLSRVREEIAATANQLVSDYDRALHDAMTPSAGAFQSQRFPTPGTNAFQPGPAPLSMPLAAPLEQTLLQGNVSIDAGLFPDLITLSAFEQALRRVSGVLRASTRGFAEGRALLDVQLAHPVALAHELRSLAPMPFAVTEASPTHLMIAIGA